MIPITVVGNLGKDAEVKQTRAGKTFTTFTLAYTPREKRDGEWVDGETMWFKVTVWSLLPEVLLNKGVRVMVTGTFKQETYEKDGQSRTVNAITATAVGSVVPAVREDAGQPVLPVVSDDWTASDDTPF